MKIRRYHTNKKFEDKIRRYRPVRTDCIAVGSCTHVLAEDFGSSHAPLLCCVVQWSVDEVRFLAQTARDWTGGSKALQQQQQQQLLETSGSKKELVPPITSYGAQKGPTSGGVRRSVSECVRQTGLSTGVNFWCTGVSTGICYGYRDIGAAGVYSGAGGEHLDGGHRRHPADGGLPRREGVSWDEMEWHSTCNTDSTVVYLYFRLNRSEGYYGTAMMHPNERLISFVSYSALLQQRCMYLNQSATVLLL